MRESSNLTRIDRLRIDASVDLARFTEPGVSGLPNWRVLSIFPAAVFVVFLLLVAFEISGTSTGAHWTNLGTGLDPRLLYGTPRTIRSDEWLVQMGWVVSQSHHGWPGRNMIFPGGVDMTVLNELPSWDWSSLFRPHLWGYLTLGLQHGLAWYWWLPGVALVSSTYLFVVTILPRRIFTAVGLAVAVFFAPLMQWWYGPSTIWPVAWVLLAMAAIVWILRDRRRWVRWTWAAVTGYFAVTMAMGLYIPYIIPVVLIFVAFAIGYLFRMRPWSTGGVRATVSCVLPILAAGVLSVGISAIWAFTRLRTFEAITSTVYPGARSESTGSVLATDQYLAGLGGAPWSSALRLNSSTTLLGGNSSEASSVFLLGLFLIGGLIVLTVARFRQTRSIDPVCIAYFACVVLLLAYLFIPGWNSVAHVLQLDKVPPDRVRIAFVVLLPLSIALAIENSRDVSKRLGWLAGGISGALALAGSAVIAVRLHQLDPATLAIARNWPAVVGLMVVACVLVFTRRFAGLGVLLLVVATLLTSWNVNPLYRGVYDLTATATGAAVQKADTGDPGEWVGLGSYETMAILVESGVSSFSGVQTYPSARMWKEIDPTSRFDDEWNRLGHIQWSTGLGDPVVANPSPDVIAVTFDACSTFAQKHVSWVLSDEQDSSSACLQRTSRIAQGALKMSIYRVVPEGGE